MLLKLIYNNQEEVEEEEEEILVISTANSKINENMSFNFSLNNIWNRERVYKKKCFLDASVFFFWLFNSNMNC